MRWFETPNINFVGNRKITYIISSIIVLIAVIAIIFKGLAYGIDFKGGKEIVLKFDNEVDVVDIREALTDPLGSEPEVKLFGGATEILIRTDNEEVMEVIEGIIVSNMQELYPSNNFNVEKSDTVGPKFADDLKRSALLSIFYSIIAIFLYILLRFRNWTFSTGAVIALAHDVLITLGVFVLLNDVVSFNLLIDQNIIAAFLTIVGYSINDTVVIYDRIRENKLVHKGMEHGPMVNKSINDTLSRTVITSLTTLFVVTVLFIFGGEVLRGFSFALMLGIILGTYSSIFVAGSLIVDLQKAKK